MSTFLSQTENHISLVKARTINQVHKPETFGIGFTHSISQTESNQVSTMHSQKFLAHKLSMLQGQISLAQSSICLPHILNPRYGISETLQHM